MSENIINNDISDKWPYPWPRPIVSVKTTGGRWRGSDWAASDTWNDPNRTLEAKNTAMYMMVEMHLNNLKDNPKQTYVATAKQFYQKYNILPPSKAFSKYYSDVSIVFSIGIYCILV